MKPIAALVLILLMTTPGLACPEQTAQAALEDTSGTPDESSAAPADASADEEQSAEETDSGDDVMKKFTRHRPGACPEGPPCKVED